MKLKDQLSNFFLTHLYCITLINYLILYLIYLFLRMLSRDYKFPILIAGILCTFSYFYKEPDLIAEKYFESDSLIYDRINKFQNLIRNIKISFFSIIFIFVTFVIFEIVYYLTGFTLFEIPLFIAFIIFAIFIISFELTLCINSFFSYDFTINYTFFNKKLFRQRLWTYLRYNKEVRNQLKNKQKIFSHGYIKKQNKKMITFEELEIVKESISELTTEQLEKIIFMDKLPSFSTEKLLSLKDYLSLIYWVGPVLIFFREDIKNFILEIIQQLYEVIRITSNNFIHELLLFFRIKEIQFIIEPLISTNQENLIQFYIYSGLLLIAVLAYLKNKIVLHFFHPRKKTIDNYLIPLIEKELEKREKNTRIKEYRKRRKTKIEKYPLA